MRISDWSSDVCSSDLMSLLIENVLAGDRLAAGEAPFEKAEIFDLNETLHAAKAGLDEDAGRRVTFIHGDKAMVKGDRILLEIAVQNLIQNALKYSATTRSEERRVGKEGVSTCRSRGSPY